MRQRRLSLIGQRFGRWTVVERAADRHPGRPHWLCRCDCGNTRVCQPSSLRNGKSKSCGCLSSELVAQRFTTHGDSINRTNTKEFRAWKDAKARCHNPTHASFHQYGAKGVQMCERWRNDYAAFLTDLGRAPAGHSLDRINPHGSYEPGNVRWADKRTQALNTRRGVKEVLVDGVSFTTKELARAYGVDPKALGQRLRHGDEPKAAIRAIQSHRPNRTYPATP